MTQRFPYTITQTNITVFVSGQIVKLPNTHVGFAPLAAHLQEKTHDADTILELADKRSALVRLTAGKVTVVGTTVYYAGAPVRSALAKRLVTLVDGGYDATPWALFMDKISQNPSEGSKERLFEYIEAWDTPLTPDGDFIAFKGVNMDYTDVHSGTFDNSPGKVVEQDRALCVEDPDVHCAAGLHACASHYLDGFWADVSRRIIAVKINPRDVVSVPNDYKLSKMRLCRYEVIGDIEDTGHRNRIERAQIVTVNDAGAVVEQKLSDRDVVIVPTEPRRETFDFHGYTYAEVTEWPLTLLEPYDDHEDEEDVESLCDMCGEDSDGHSVCEDCAYDEENGVVILDKDEDASYREPVILTQAMRVEEEAPEDMPAFEHTPSGRMFTAKYLVESVVELGQRGFARKFGIPRTTLQDWLRRAQEAGY